METTELKLMINTIIFFFFLNLFPAYSVDVCNPTVCSEMGMGPEIRFPFRLKNRQPDRCGYPGFDLSCNERGQTIITLPSSGDFLVTDIDYTTQSIILYDPDFCLVRRLIDFNITNSQFRAAHQRNYTIVRCTSDDWLNYPNYQVAIPLFCRGVSSRNQAILAMPPNMYAQGKPPSCKLMSKVSVPLQLEDNFWSPMEGLVLTWSEPSCRICENQGKLCGFKSDTGSDIACSNPPSSKGLPRGAKYGIIIGVGVPGFVCLLGLISFAFGKIKVYALRRDLNTDLPTTINLQSAIATTGLNRATIDSYPKIVLGESKRLPNPNDGTCPICLSDYQPKETLRTIPECNHYFHAECIDEWLKLNATCPLCRNTPDGSLHPCSSSTSLVSSSP
ncbi:PREDICTED: RING-H2 finger protein ATL20-like [Nicotiana attenuata]|uniref:RING-type E3 ubiquitin transferase n=1 Tax=Nicotiana attenuata TaxID=49451 RepID=A0A1J6IBP4_NICAT|nr:PREDICTED: RING-H2 finger protein ATL20-like [Nicotiana attenuata]OIT01994.1 putative ring-h2 finger protein atl21a [Nicotiana attenuata]